MESTEPPRKTSELIYDIDEKFETLVKESRENSLTAFENFKQQITPRKFAAYKLRRSLLKKHGIEDEVLLQGPIARLDGFMKRTLFVPGLANPYNLFVQWFYKNETTPLPGFENVKLPSEYDLTIKQGIQAKFIGNLWNNLTLEQKQKITESSSFKEIKEKSDLFSKVYLRERKDLKSELKSIQSQEDEENEENEMTNQKVKVKIKEKKMLKEAKEKEMEKKEDKKKEMEKKSQ